MKKLIGVFAIVAIMAITSCTAPSGHRSQSWHPHVAKGGQQYKR